MIAETEVNRLLSRERAETRFSAETAGVVFWRVNQCVFGPSSLRCASRRPLLSQPVPARLLADLQRDERTGRCLRTWDGEEAIENSIEGQGGWRETVIV